MICLISSQFPLRMRDFYIVWLFGLSRIQITYAANLTNVALSKETIASSFFEEQYITAFTVDGDIDQLNIARCFHSAAETQPFWEVDLLQPYIVDNIKVYNRQDCCTSHLSDVKVDTSTDQVTYTQFGYHEGILLDTYVFYSETPMVVGRWFKISITGDPAFLSLCEVEVMSNMTLNYNYLTKVHGAKGTGSVLSTRTGVSLSRCVFLCQMTKHCQSVNVRQEVMSSTEWGCQLLDDVIYETSSDPDITFWTMAIEM